MSQTKKSEYDSRREPRILQGYRQEGKRFIPPFLQYGNLTETSWIDDRVPELIWIALLIQVFGEQEGARVATSIAKAAAGCKQEAKRAFAAISDYELLGEEDRLCVRSTLQAEEMLDIAHSGLAALTNHYARFPLAFLAESDSAGQNVSMSTLDDLRATIENINDRESRASVFAQATAIYICLLNDKLKIASNSGLANLSAIEEYPSTGESRMVAALVRSAVVGVITWETPSVWRNYFWNQGRALGACEVA